MQQLVHCCLEPHLVAFASPAFLVTPSLLPILPSADVMPPVLPQKLVLPAYQDLIKHVRFVKMEVLCALQSYQSTREHLSFRCLCVAANAQAYSQCRSPPADDLLPWLLRLPDAVPLSRDSKSHEGVPKGFGIFARSSSAAASSAARSATGQLSAAAGGSGDSAAAAGSLAITTLHSAACSTAEDVMQSQKIQARRGRNV